MKYRLIILPQAREDLRRNAEWWGHHHSSDQAARWLDTVQSQLETIVDFPMSHSLSAENGNVPCEIREKLSDSVRVPATGRSSRSGTTRSMF